MKSNSPLQKRIYTLLLAILAGVAIGIGGIVYLSIEVKIVGALMFTAGLYTICVHELNLFTGKVGYLPEKHSPDDIITLLLIWIGNFLGTLFTAAVILQTRAKGISKLAKTMCKTKTADNLLSLFILGIFCGFLMYVAVDGYGKTKNPIILFIGVATFILAGFEHCIADMFYISVAKMWSWDTILRIIIISLGNALGGSLILLFKKVKPSDGSAPKAS